jgi:dephospho-CoA kinase
VLDVPLLIEGGLHTQVDKVWVVYVDRDTQLRRLMQRDRLSREAAEARLAAQMPLDDKLRFASAVIDNRGGHEETRTQVRALWQSALAGTHAVPEPDAD